MKKTDEYVVNIVSSSIQRSSRDRETWQYTKFWSDLTAPIEWMLRSKLSFDVGELPILAVVLDEDNWTIFSSRAVHGYQEGQYVQVKVSEITSSELGDFKGYRSPVDVLRLQTRDGSRRSVLYETGKASMGAIYALQTLQQVCIEG
jgi:hypothetical protein